MFVDDCDGRYVERCWIQMGKEHTGVFLDVQKRCHAAAQEGVLFILAVKVVAVERIEGEGDVT